MQRIATAGLPMGRWKEGLMFEGIAPMPWMKSAAVWYPGTEEVQPDEMRITFMGTAPIIRPGQMNTSIQVELGNGETFVFDFGEGAISNYLAAGRPLNQINDIFLTHLHVDHWGSLPYLYCFGAWGGRWHEPLRVYGPSGETDEDGISHLIHHMKEMLRWHRSDFDLSPIGRGWDIEVTEVDFRDHGGTVLERNGVNVKHWEQSHGKDGASAYRLDWNGLSVAFTGDGRPNSLSETYASGVDVLITEIQPELVALSSAVQGALPMLGRFTIDTHHNPGYAAGYLYNKCQPRLAMGTHMPWDAYSNAEIIAEVRHHWSGPFQFGAPDMIVVNVTKESIWVREGVLPEYPSLAPPKFDVSAGHLAIPAPSNTRESIQNQAIRDAEIDPTEYYPPDYYPDLLTEWPTDKPLAIPADRVSERMKK